MYEITLKKGGVDKTFSKDFIQVRQSAVFSSDEHRLDAKEHRKLNESYLQMFVEMYGNQFTIDDLKQSDMTVLDKLNDLFVDALGGEKEEDEKKER